MVFSGLIKGAVKVIRIARGGSVKTPRSFTSKPTSRRQIVEEIGEKRDKYGKSTKII